MAWCCGGSGMGSPDDTVLETSEGLHRAEHNGPGLNVAPEAHASLSPPVPVPLTRDARSLRARALRCANGETCCVGCASSSGCWMPHDRPSAHVPFPGVGLTGRPFEQSLPFCRGLFGIFGVFCWDFWKSSKKHSKKNSQKFPKIPKNSQKFQKGCSLPVAFMV